MDLAKLIVTIVIAVVGWAATYFAARWHTLQTERRKSRVEFLIKTYKRITELRVFVAEQDSASVARFLADITADIELQGTQIQTELAAQATTQLLTDGSLSALDTLAQNLLNDLRANMKLPKVERRASVFGYTGKTIPVPEPRPYPKR